MEILAVCNLTAIIIFFQVHNIAKVYPMSHFPLFVLELNTSHKAKEKIRKAKLRSQKPIVGDINPLLSALADIDISLPKDKISQKGCDRCVLYIFWVLFS